MTDSKAFYSSKTTINWWYPSIADWMLRNPGKPIKACAAEIGRSYLAVRLIVASDVFQEYFRKRRAEWTKQHDDELREKLFNVSSMGLDILQESLEKKRTTIPMQVLSDVTTSALDRLGYSPNRPSDAAVQINNYNNGAVAVVPVSADALREAQDAIRVAERKRTLMLEPRRSEPERSEGERRAQRDKLNTGGADYDNGRVEPAFGLDIIPTVDPADDDILPPAVGSNN